MKKLLIALLFTVSLTSIAQEKAYHEEVLEYLEVNGTRAQYANAVDGLFDLLRKQYAGQDIPDKVWTELKEESPKQVDRILTMLVSAYRGTYEQEDIQNMLAFYKTEAGVQLLSDKTALDYEQQKDAAVFYNTPTGQKILSSQQEIASRVSEISEIWSRDLYRATIDKLADKGFMMPQ